ncbi:Dicarboxylate/amino acid:cation symporter [Globisporangium polare]
MRKEGSGGGFVLYNLNMDDGNSSQSSAPSAPSPYSLGPPGSATRLAPRNNFRAPPPPHTAVLRTNFTTNAGGGNGGGARGSIGAQDDFAASPDTGFQDVRTPHMAVVNGGGATQQFIDAVAPEQQKSSSSIFSTVAILVCIVLGLVVGTVLNHYKVEGAITDWIKTPGDLYIRAIQCIVVPLVFVNLAVSVADLIHIGKGQAIGIRVALFFLGTTLIGIGEGIGMGFVARGLYNQSSAAEKKSTEAIFGIQCSNGNYLEMLGSGLVTCSATTMNSTSKFSVDDVNSAFKRTTTSLDSSSSVSDNLIEILHMVVPANIMEAFVDNTLLSIVAFAIPCGITLAKSFHGPIQLNPLLEFLREVNESLVVMTNWVIYFTPYAVFSLLAGSFGADLTSVVTMSPIVLTLSMSGLFIAAVLVHVLIVIPLIFTLFTRSNPFTYMRHMLPAYVYAVGCSSSVASLPVTMRCIEQSREVSNSVMYFVMSIGASLNMNGTAIYLPMMVFFLVDGSGLNNEFGSLQIGVLVLASFLGSLAAAPVPAGSLVMLTTVWKIAMPGRDLPALYSLLVAADVVLDRVVTFCNINGDAMVCRIINDQVDETLTGEIMRNHQPIAAM